MLRRHEEPVLLVPLVVLSGKILTRHELGIEHSVARLVLSVGDVYGLQNRVHELAVLLVRRNLQAQELGSVGQAVHADGKVLLAHVDEAGLVDVQHVRLEEIQDNLIESGLILVYPARHLADFSVNESVQCLLVVFHFLGKRLSLRDVDSLCLLEEFSCGSLYKSVQINGHHGLGTGGHRSCTHRILMGGMVMLLI